VQQFIRISAENVSSQLSRILAVFFLLIATIRLSRLSDAIAFQPSGIYKNRLGVYPKRWLYLLCICWNIYTQPIAILSYTGWPITSIAVGFTVPAYTKALTGW